MMILCLNNLMIWLALVILKLFNNLYFRFIRLSPAKNTSQLLHSTNFMSSRFVCICSFCIISYFWCFSSNIWKETTCIRPCWGANIFCFLPSIFGEITRTIISISCSCRYTFSNSCSRIPSRFWFLLYYFSCCIEGIFNAFT